MWGNFLLRHTVQLENVFKLVTLFCFRSSSRPVGVIHTKGFDQAKPSSAQRNGHVWNCIGGPLFFPQRTRYSHGIACCIFLLPFWFGNCRHMLVCFVDCCCGCVAIDAGQTLCVRCSKWLHHRAAAVQNVALVMADWKSMRENYQFHRRRFPFVNKQERFLFFC